MAHTCKHGKTLNIACDECFQAQERLHDAAPDLLAVCKAVLAYPKNEFYFGRKVAEMAKDAIARAESSHV